MAKEGIIFISREATEFENSELLKKGRYTQSNTTTDRYEGELTATYAKVIGMHTINAVIGGNLQVSTSKIKGFSVIGFPEGDFTYPSFSNGYPDGSKPTYTESEQRSMYGYMNIGYAYNNQSLIDFIM